MTENRHFWFTAPILMKMKTVWARLNINKMLLWLKRGHDIWCFQPTTLLIFRTIYLLCWTHSVVAATNEPCDSTEKHLSPVEHSTDSPLAGDCTGSSQGSVFISKHGQSFNIYDYPVGWRIFYLFIFYWVLRDEVYFHILF